MKNTKRKENRTATMLKRLVSPKTPLGGALVGGACVFLLFISYSLISGQTPEQSRTRFVEKYQSVNQTAYRVPVKAKNTR
ncbi:MAG: hypothetical protein AB203_01125 [Parcubacteria bacterium C7867-008]|nr:MAG: hypothetical protein AB203_01125 [Parcubacteria bacterium C7867-008]